MLEVNYHSKYFFLFSLHIVSSIFFILLLYLEIGVFEEYLNYIGSYKWLLSLEVYELNLETELARSRIIYAFVLLASILKFWHFILIAVVWFFFLGRFFEDPENREVLLTSVFQSFLILYGLNFLMLAPYFKYLARKYMSNPYYWFFEAPNYESLFIAWDFVKVFYFGC